jgi:hypothetical protein
VVPIMILKLLRRIGAGAAGRKLRRWDCATFVEEFLVPISRPLLTFYSYAESRDSEVSTFQLQMDFIAG